MTGHEVRIVHQVRGTDGGLAEAQVGLGESAGLLGVVHEICLAVQVGGVADDLDGVFVGAHGAVGAHSPDFHVGLSLGSGLDLFGDGQGSVGHVVHDADGEIVLRRIGLKVLVHGENLPRSGVLGA